MKDFEMKNKSHKFGLYLPTFLTVLIAAVVMRTVALFIHYNPQTFYFSGKILISISNYTVIAAVIIFFSYIFTAQRDMRLIPSFTSPATYIPTLAVAVAIAFIIVHAIKKAGKSFAELNRLASLSSSYYAEQIAAYRTLAILLIAAAVFAALSLIHFVLNALTEKHSSSRRANLGLCAVVFLSLYPVYLYFSTELPLNAPNKLVDQMAYLFASVFFLFETRLSIAREKWRPYIAFGFIASLLTAYSSIPAILVYLARGTLMSASIYESTLTLALFIFITARLFLTTRLIEDKPSPTAVTLLSFSEKRSEDILKNQVKAEHTSVEDGTAVSEEPSEETSPDENQITIDIDGENDENQISIYDGQIPYEKTDSEPDSNE